MAKSPRKERAKPQKKPKPRRPHLRTARAILPEDDFDISTQSLNSPNCPPCYDGIQGRDSGGSRVEIACDSAGCSTCGCRRGIFQYDLSSIPTNASIVKVEFLPRVDDVNPGTVRNTHVVKYNLPDRPSAKNDNDVWTEISNRITAGDYILENTGSLSSIGDKTIDLGASAVSDMQSKLSQRWWAFGIVLKPEGRDSADNSIKIVSKENPQLGIRKPRIKVTYDY